MIQAPHAVGLGPENRLEHVRRHDLEVVREVEPRRSVQEAAVGFDEADELHLAEILRALEHHVLEEVREPGAVLRLDAETDVEVDGDDRRWGRRVAREHDLQPVLELEVVDRDLELPGSRRRLRRSQQPRRRHARGQRGRRHGPR